MRRTPRTEFADSRRAADEARRALLQRVKLREPEPEPTEVDPVAPTARQIEAITDQIRNLTITFREASEPSIWDDIQRAMASVASASRAEAYRYHLTRWTTGARRNYAPGIETWDQQIDAHRHQPGMVRAPYDPVVWPDEGYPCQVCWSVGRWPWEPARSCPASVDPVSTHCVEHGGQARTPKTEGLGANVSWVFMDETREHSARMFRELAMAAPVISEPAARRIFTGVV